MTGSAEDIAAIHHREPWGKCETPWDSLASEDLFSQAKLRKRCRDLERKNEFLEARLCGLGEIQSARRPEEDSFSLDSEENSSKVRGFARPRILSPGQAP